MNGSKGLDIVVVVSSCLERLLTREDVETTTKFHAQAPPAISLMSYLKRIHQYANCSSTCFIVSLIYIDRLCQHSYLSLSILNIHRIVITAVCLAAKFHDDFYYPNQFYSQVGGISLAELNMLEIEFLFGINFGLFVDRDCYQKYEEALFYSERRRLEDDDDEDFEEDYEDEARRRTRRYLIEEDDYFVT